MTDEMRVALIAVAIGCGVDVDAAWAIVGDAERQKVTDVRELTAFVAARAKGSAWDGFAGIRG